LAVCLADPDRRGRGELRVLLRRLLEGGPGLVVVPLQEPLPGFREGAGRPLLRGRLLVVGRGEGREQGEGGEGNRGAHRRRSVGGRRPVCPPYRGDGRVATV